MSVIKCERSVITMTLLRLGYLVYSLDNRVMTLLTETGLKSLPGMLVCTAPTGHATLFSLLLFLLYLFLIIWRK